LPEYEEALKTETLAQWTAQNKGCAFLGRVLKSEMAARILMSVLSFAHHDPKHATLEKAYSLIGEAFGKAGYRGASRAYLAKIWAEKSPVAHICAAKDFFPEDWHSGTNQGLLWVLNVADRLRDLGENHRLNRQGNRTLLNPDMIRASMMEWPRMTR
jgi:hypothetical protein